MKIYLWTDQIKIADALLFFFFAPLHVAEEPTATQLSTLGNFVHIE